MAFLKKSNTNISEIKKEVEVKDLGKTESPYLNSSEEEALAAQVENEVSNTEDNSISTAKMESAVRVVQNTFNIANADFILNGFSDKKGTSVVALANDDFEIVVKIKDNEKYGIY